MYACSFRSCAGAEEVHVVLSSSAVRAWRRRGDEFETGMDDVLGAAGEMREGRNGRGYRCRTSRGSAVGRSNTYVILAG